MTPSPSSPSSSVPGKRGGEPGRLAMPGRVRPSPHPPLVFALCAATPWISGTVIGGARYKTFFLHHGWLPGILRPPVRGARSSLPRREGTGSGCAGEDIRDPTCLQVPGNIHEKA
jgi:hypothetical protein